MQNPLSGDENEDAQHAVEQNILNFDTSEIGSGEQLKLVFEL